MNKGILSAICAYTLWGLLPVYWKSIQHVPVIEILCHRWFWSLIIVVFILYIQKRWKWLKNALKNRLILTTFACTASIIAINSFTFIWAVNSQYIVEASLGYFINPLISVLLGVIILRERLRFRQWTAIGIAACGVIYLTSVYGSFPWIALTLAFSFGLYGLLKKTASLNAIEGLMLETGILFIPVLMCLIFFEIKGSGSFGHTQIKTSILLFIAGAATVFPLLLFASAAKKIKLSTLGFMQYITPTLQFLLGVFIYAEPFTRTRLIGFCLVWISLIIYSIEEFTHRKREKQSN
jgi:chloramphenicol-sensitive protein RarD